MPARRKHNISINVGDWLVLEREANRRSAVAIRRHEPKVTPGDLVREAIAAYIKSLGKKKS